MYNEYMRRKNTIKMDDLEVRLFMEAPIWYYPILTRTFHSISLRSKQPIASARRPPRRAKQVAQGIPVTRSSQWPGGARWPGKKKTRENAVKMG